MEIIGVTDIDAMLGGRLRMPEIKRIVAWASEDPANREALFKQIDADDSHVGANALWCLTHLRAQEKAWLQSLQSRLIDMVIKETEVSKKRMLLQLLREQDYTADSIRVDFLDFCLSKINSECEPYAIRCFCLYVAYKMCRFYPELQIELNEHLALLSQQNLSPGLRCARRKVAEKLQKLKSE